MAERGRRAGFTMSHEHRTKIQNSRILTCLIDHVEGRLDMSPTQVTAGIALLKKVLPDLSAMAIDAHVTGAEATKEQIDAAIEAFRITKLGQARIQ